MKAHKMLLAAIGLVLQACAALGQSSYYPNGGTQSFNLTPYCRSGIAGTLSFNGGSVIESTPDTATVRQQRLRYALVLNT